MNPHKALKISIRNLTIQQKKLGLTKQFLDQIIKNIHTLPDINISMDSTGSRLKATRKRFRKLRKHDLVRHKLATHLLKMISQKDLVNSINHEDREKLKELAESMRLADRQIRFFLDSGSPIDHAIDLEPLPQFDGTAKQFIEKMLVPLENRLELYGHELQKSYDFFEKNPFIKTCVISAHGFRIRINPFGSAPETIVDTSFLINAAEYARDNGAQRLHIDYDGQLILIPQVKREMVKKLAEKKLSKKILHLIERDSETPDKENPTYDEVDTLEEIWEGVVKNKNRESFTNKGNADINILTRALRRIKRGEKTLILSDDKDIIQVGRRLRRGGKPIVVRTWDEAVKKVA